MTKRTKTNLKIISATAVGLFSLTSLFTGTMAWFITNQNTPVTGMNISVQLTETELSSLTVHRCDLSNSTKTTLKFDPNPSVVVSGHGSVVEASGVQMSNYSMLNQTQPVLLLFTFSEELYEDDLTVSAKTANASFTSSLTAQNVSNFPFSSVVKFKCISYNTNSFPFASVDLLDANEDPLYSTSSFVTINGNGSQPPYNYTATPTLFAGSSHTAITHLAVILDYYSEAIEYIRSQTGNYISIVGDNNNVIDYFCDWTLEM